MVQYTNTSFIFKVLDRFRSYFIASCTYKVLDVLLEWCKHSEINQLIVLFLARNSSLKHSITFKICSKVFSFFDHLWEKLYNFGTNCGNSSYVISFITNSFCNENSFEALGLLVLFFSFGFGVTSLLLGNFYTLQAILVGLGVLIALLLFLGKPKWVACLKNSIFWRFALYIFD